VLLLVVVLVLTGNRSEKNEKKTEKADKKKEEPVALKKPEPEKKPDPEKKPEPEKKPPAKPVAPELGIDPATLALVRDSVKKQNYVKTEIVGFSIGEVFEEVPAEGGVLIGFEVGLGKFIQNDVIHSLRPIFLTEKGEVLGQVHGTPTDRIVTVKAKKGYAVGGVNLNTHLLIDGIQVTFMRVEKKFLDPDQSYQSDPIGSIGGKFGSTKSLSSQGALVIGMCGKVIQNQCRAFGLVLRGKPQ